MAGRLDHTVPWNAEEIGCSCVLSCADISCDGMAATPLTKIGPGCWNAFRAPNHVPACAFSVLNRPPENLDARLPQTPPNALWDLSSLPARAAPRPAQCMAHCPVTDLMTRMERKRKEAEKFFRLGPQPFLRGYYWRIAERYLGRGRSATKLRVISCASARPRRDIVDAHAPGAPSSQIGPPTDWLQPHDFLHSFMGSAQGRCSTVARSVPCLLLHEPWGHGP